MKNYAYRIYSMKYEGKLENVLVRRSKNARELNKL